MSIGAKITMLRKSAGLSQEQLAGLLGVSRQAVSKWENDQSVPDIAYITALARAFQVTTDSMLLEESETSAGENTATHSLEAYAANTMRFKTSLAYMALGIVGIVLVFVYYIYFGSQFEPYYVLGIEMHGVWAWIFQCFNGYSFNPLPLLLLCAGIGVLAYGIYQLRKPLR